MTQLSPKVRDTRGAGTRDLIRSRVETRIKGTYQVEEMAVRAYLDHARCSRKGVERMAKRASPVPKDPAPMRFVRVR